MTLPQFFDSNICFLHKSITFAMFIPGILWFQAIGFGFYKDNSIPTHSDMFSFISKSRQNAEINRNGIMIFNTLNR